MQIAINLRLYKNNNESKEIVKKKIETVMKHICLSAGIRQTYILLIAVCFLQNSTESQFINPPTGSNRSIVTVLSTQLLPGMVYVFTLTVQKAGRTPVSVAQTVSINLIPICTQSVAWF